MGHPLPGQEAALRAGGLRRACRAAPYCTPCRNSKLTHPPLAQLSALTNLGQLDLQSNPALARAGAATWHPLASLRRLREVNLSLCRILAAPASLAPLRCAGTEFKITFATEEEMYAEIEVR